MTANLSEVITLLLGGGLVAIVTVLIKAVREWREGRTAREDTAISRWRDLANEQKHAADKGWGLVAIYRSAYIQLWAAYASATGDRSSFPADPVSYAERKRPDKEDT